MGELAARGVHWQRTEAHITLALFGVHLGRACLRIGELQVLLNPQEETKI